MRDFLIRDCGEGGLAEADAAIVRRNEPIGPNPQMIGLQKVLDIAQQQVVLKDTAGKHDGVELAGLAQGDDCVAKSASNSSLKSTGDPPSVVAA